MQATAVLRFTAITLGTGGGVSENITANSKFWKIFFISNLVLQVRMWNWETTVLVSVSPVWIVLGLQPTLMNTKASISLFFFNLWFQTDKVRWGCPEEVKVVKLSTAYIKAHYKWMSKIDVSAVRWNVYQDVGTETIKNSHQYTYLLILKDTWNNTFYASFASSLSQNYRPQGDNLEQRWPSFAAPSWEKVSVMKTRQIYPTSSDIHGLAIFSRHIIMDVKLQYHSQVIVSQLEHQNLSGLRDCHNGQFCFTQWGSILQQTQNCWRWHKITTTYRAIILPKRVT